MSRLQGTRLGVAAIAVALILVVRVGIVLGFEEPPFLETEKFFVTEAELNRRLQALGLSDSALRSHEELEQLASQGVLPKALSAVLETPARPDSGCVVDSSYAEAYRSGPDTLDDLVRIVEYLPAVVLAEVTSFQVGWDIRYRSAATLFGASIVRQFRNDEVFGEVEELPRNFVFAWSRGAFYIGSRRVCNDVYIDHWSPAVGARVLAVGEWKPGYGLYGRFYELRENTILVPDGAGGSHEFELDALIARLGL